mmetsp:Transcript_3662/g.8122  ORF Transcript_3662/g.8122 Transcript_3662/m.8122 type:complete len:281 (+) Transcript_3662:513-1355(+)
MHHTHIAVGDTHVRSVEARHVVVPKPFTKALEGNIKSGIAEPFEHVLPRHLIPRRDEMHVEVPCIRMVPMSKEFHELILRLSIIGKSTRLVDVKPITDQSKPLPIRQQTFVQLHHAPLLGMLQKLIRESLLQSQNIRILRSHWLAIVSPRHGQRHSGLQWLILQIYNLGNFIHITRVHPIFRIEPIGNANRMPEETSTSIRISIAVLRPRLMPKLSIIEQYFLAVVNITKGNILQCQLAGTLHDINGMILQPRIGIVKVGNVLKVSVKVRSFFLVVSPLK